MLFLFLGAVIVCCGLVALRYILGGHGDDVTVSEHWLDEFHRNE